MENQTHSKQFILSINIDARASTLFELKNMIAEINPIVCLIQDPPHIRTEDIIRILRVIAPFNYEYVLHEKVTNRSNTKINNIILVNTDEIIIKNIHTYNEGDKADALGISITWNKEHYDNNDKDDNNNNDANNNTCSIIKNGLIVFSTYIRPKALHGDTKKCLDWIKRISKDNEGHSRTIIAGDFNSIHPSWSPISNIINNKENSLKHYNQIKIVRGRFIAKSMKHMKLTCLNQPIYGPTFNNGNHTAYIDLAFVGNKVIRTWDSMKLKQINEIAHHKALIIQSKHSYNGSKTRQDFKTKTYKRIEVENLNENHFLELNLRCKLLLSNWKQLPRERIKIRLDTIMKLLYKAIINAQICITRTIQRRTYKKSYNNLNKDGFNSKVRKQMRKLKRQDKKLKSLNSRMKSINMNHSTFSELRRSKIKLKEKYRKLRNKILNCIDNNKLHMAFKDLNEQDLWSKIESINNYLTKENRRTHLNLDEEIDGLHHIKTQQDIDRLAEIKFPFVERNTLKSVDDIHEEGLQRTCIKINQCEIDFAIKNLNKKTYTSPEGIRMKVFIKSITYIKEIINTIAEMSFWVCYIPKECRITQGTLIPKKTKGQFRIVHVSSPIAALLEVIALKRLEYRLEINLLNSPYQFGFSALKSRHDLVSRILELSFKNKFTQIDQTAASTIIISLDIEGAFDNVNQDMLIYKMYHEIDYDPIKFWLAEFILNRQIIIKKGELKSETKNVCLGVPQGSALGPILWNYMIRDIEIGIVWPGKIELLKYADDILLIYNENSKHELQRLLDDLVKKLAQIDLRIRPEKCSFMVTTITDSRNYKEYNYKIDRTPIKQVKTMNILGIPLTNKLKLDRNSKEHYEKLITNAKKLHTMNGLGLINSASEWRILIDSFIISRIVINNWPMLIVDKESRKWTNDMVIKMMRIIFEWPKNTSIKIIRLITKTLSTDTLIKKIVKFRETTDLGKIYTFLKQLLNENKIIEYSLCSFHDDLQPINMETDMIVRRKQFNPSKMINIKQIECIPDEMDKNGPGWFILDRASGSMAVEMLLDELKQKRLGKHYDYPISYFNSFALIGNMAQDKTIHYRCLYLGENNSILKALENLNNHDWRVIELRERLWDNGWRINIIKNEHDEVMRDYLAVVYKGLKLTNEPDTADNTNHYGQHNPEEQIRNQNALLNETIKIIYDPYLMDYKRRNHLNCKATKEEELEYISYHTTLTSILCNDIQIWQDMPPNWLNGYKIMALGGLYKNNETNQLDHEQHNQVNCLLCCNLTNHEDNNEELPIWHNINTTIINHNVILHRMMECNHFSKIRKDFFMKLNMEMIIETTQRHEVLLKILKNRKTLQSFLGFMSKCAMNENK